MLLIGLIFCFILILLLVKNKVPIGVSVICGGIILALFGGLSPSKIIIIILKTFTEKPTLELIATVIMISVLSTVMKEYGVLDLMVGYLEKLFKSTKILLFVIPSLLSTFTVTGSAIVAAPIIDSLGDKTNITPSRKAAINLYIRHIWYFILPIAVPLINASYIGNIPIARLITAQLPVALICFFFAFLIYIKPINSPIIKNNNNEKNIYLKTLLYTSPLIICVFLVFWIPFYLALTIGSILAYFLRVKEKNFLEVLIKSKNIPLVLAAAGIMIFKNFIANLSGLKLLVQQVVSTGIPLELIIILLSVTIAYAVANPTLLVGMMFPLILPIVPPEKTVPIAVLIYTVGFSAYFISPVHLCQALTNEYFKVSTGELYKEYKITVPVMFISGIITYFFIS